MIGRIFMVALLTTLSTLGVTGQGPQQPPLVRFKDQLEAIKEALNSVTKDVLGNEPLDTFKVAEQDRIARQLWQLYDSEVVRLLNTHKQLDESALNQLFADARERIVDKGTGPEITFYELVPRTDQTWIARYSYTVKASPYVSTFHLVGIIGGKHKVVAKAEDTGFYLTLEPHHRQEAKQQWRQTSWEAGKYRYGQLWQATTPLINKAIGIRVLPRGQEKTWRFLTTYEGWSTGPRYETIVEWQWDGKRLEAISWVWNDEWELTEIGDPMVGILHSKLPDRDGKKVKYEELFKAGPKSDFRLY